jgi:DNA-binding response OmpR family regulator
MIQKLFKRGTDEPPISVFVVSDDAAILALLVDSLTTDGYVVTSAASGAIAVKLLDEIELPNLFIGDFIHPETDGREFLERVRIRFGRSALPPMLFLMDTPEDEITAEAMGVQDLLPKPFEIEILLQRVKALLENAEPPNA